MKNQWKSRRNHNLCTLTASSRWRGSPEWSVCHAWRCSSGKRRSRTLLSNSDWLNLEAVSHHQVIQRKERRNKTGGFLELEGKLRSNFGGRRGSFLLWASYLLAIYILLLAMSAFPYCNSVILFCQQIVRYSCIPHIWVTSWNGKVEKNQHTNFSLNKFSKNSLPLKVSLLILLPLFSLLQ